VLVATVRDREFTLHPVLNSGARQRLDGTVVHALADRSVDLLRAHALARPWEWAWVRALAVIAVAVVMGCSPSEPLPPLPLDPQAWRADIDNFAWQGDIQGAALELTAGTARVRQLDSSWVGAFEEIRLLWVTDDGHEVEVRGAAALGTLPTGPLTVTRAVYSIDGVTGETAELRWLGNRALECGGCPLETVLEHTQRSAP
jgi:hypothetical protein